MRVLIINTSEQIGGAAIAANRLMHALNAAEVNAQMLVLHKTSQSAKVLSIGKSWQKKYTFMWERLVIWLNNFFSRKNLFTISIANTGFNITRLPAFQQADIIHLHWINQGMLSLHNIKEIINSGKPIVWTMHDMWECTAICHYAYTCDAFKSECRDCFFLRFPGKYDLANRVFKKKQRLFKNADLNIVTVSTWLAEQVRQSALLKEKKISVIPNTLSLSDFKMLDKEQCRKALALPDKYLILFGAARLDNPIKGFDILLEAIRHLIATHKFNPEQLHLVIFGKIKHPEPVLPKIPVGYSDFGRIADSSLLSQLYSAEGIYWGLTQRQTEISRDSMRNNVLQKYSSEIVAGQYIHLYRNLISKQ